MAERRSTPSNEPRISSRLNDDSVLSAAEVAETISEVKVAAAAEQAAYVVELLGRPLGIL